MTARRSNTFFARARRSRALLAGVTLFGLILLATLLAPVIAPYSPSTQNLTAGLLPPSNEHWFGTDQLGRDVFSRLLFAAQTDLRLAITAAIAPFIIGVTVGVLSGYFGKTTDWVASRIIDVVIAFPFYVLVIAIVFAVGAGEPGIIAAFAMVGWVGYARVLKATTSALRDSGWVQAARGGGLSHARVLVRHLLPNVLPQAIVLLMTEIVLIMVAIVTLGYLGLGVQPPTPDWGTMISDGQQFVQTHWWLSALPGLAVVITGIALSLIGDGLGDALRVEEVGGRPSRARRDNARADSSLTRKPGRQMQESVRDYPAVAPGSIVVSGLRVETTAEGTGNARGALVAGIDFEVSPGEALGLVGESGSGKSLTLRAILGLMPTGTRVSAGEALAVGNVGMVFQDPLAALDPLTRVGAQLIEVLRAAPPPARGDSDRRGYSGSIAHSGLSGIGFAGSMRERAHALLRQVQLPDTERIFRAYPHQLSGGQRQRIVIALALAGNPDVLLCDEPTTALDVTVQQQVLALLDTLRREQGITLLFVSHDLAVVASLCSRIAVMQGGRIVETGETSRVISAPNEAYTRALLEAVPELPPLRAELRSGVKP